jgi:hypothetical protein
MVGAASSNVGTSSRQRNGLTLDHATRVINLITTRSSLAVADADRGERHDASRFE